MINSYFINLESIVFDYLQNAKSSLEIAVAWINFDIYYNLLLSLCKNGVKIAVIADDNDSNRRYINSISSLKASGVEIKLVKFHGIMHHKFCVIDNRNVLFGSFNWTRQANIKNIEDINICDDINVVNLYRMEFNALWELSDKDIVLLRNPEKCHCCGNPIFNILLMEQEGDNTTKIKIIQQCSGMCFQQEMGTFYYDISVYNSYIGLINQYNDEIEKYLPATDFNTLQYVTELRAERDFQISTYLSTVRTNRMNMPIIHAIAVKSWSTFDRHNGQWEYKIIWKERGTDTYIEDSYPIE